MTRRPRRAARSARAGRRAKRLIRLRGACYRRPDRRAAPRERTDLREIAVDGPLDLVATLSVLAVPGDPTLRVSPQGLLRATRTPEGPACLRVVVTAPGRLRASAWGEGGAWVLERVPDLLGLADAPTPLPARAPPPLRELARRARGLRLARTHRVLELLVVTILQQQVQGLEAARAYRHLVRAFSERAPGPGGLWLPLGPRELRALPPAALPALGVPPRQGETLRRVGWHARALEEAATLPPAEAERRLTAVPGVGPWTARMVALRGLGDADAVPPGDWNLPRAVAWSLAGEARADDARMLELLEPYRGQRGRVIRWILAHGGLPPRRGPRHRLRPLPDAPEARRLRARGYDAPGRGRGR